MISKKVGMTFLALTLSLVSCGQDEVLPESSETQVNPLVINGVPSELGARPYQVALLGQNCGGVIISKKWILTAAHCVEEESGSDISIRAGSLDRYNGGQLRPAKRIVKHPDHTKRHFANNDIAVIELESDLEFNDSVSAAALPTKAIEQEHAAPGSVQIISGWGRHTTTGQISNQLLEAPLKVMTNQTCDQKVKILDRAIGVTDQMICGAINEKAQASCFGNSGGPFASKVNGKHVVFGVVSWGDRNCQHISVFARVSALQEWITKTTGVQPGQARETQPDNPKDNPKDTVKYFSKVKPISRLLHYYPARGEGFKHTGGNIGILFNIFNKSDYIVRLERLNDSGEWELKARIASIQPLGKINGDFPAGSYRVQIYTPGKDSFYQIMGNYNGK